MILFSIFWIRRQFNDPMSQLMDALGKVEKGDLKMNIQYDRDDEFHYIYDKFNSMVTELNNQIELNYEHRIRTQQAELKQLQYHIKPHFLYNSIFLIYRMAGQGDQEAIQDFCLTLGNYYRYITRIENQTIPLERELGHIRDYIKIQSIRFGERIVVNMDPTPEGMQNQLVLPLMLQPIVENAYHHGLAMVESGGQIDIHMTVDDDIFTVTVDDNGKGLTPEELDRLTGTILENKAADTHTGLSNVHHRLRIQFGPESGLRLEHSPIGGLRVVLKLKFAATSPVEQQMNHAGRQPGNQTSSQTGSQIS
jgi:two-component system sensor histidine kinase YesM